jgi:hypothetical protein
VDLAVQTFGLGDKVKSGCFTETLRLVQSDRWSRNLFIELTQQVCVLFSPRLSSGVLIMV